MPVPSDITALSSTAGSNFPLGSESPATTDDYLRAHAAFIAQLRDGKEPNAAAGTTAQYWRGDKTWQDLPAAVRAALLTGLSTASSADVAATDTVLAAIGKLQAGKVSRDSATGAATLPAGTDAQRPGTPTNGMLRYNTTSGKIEGYQVGVWREPGGISLGVAQATTSGTAIDFTGIPSWVNRITVMFGGVSTSGGSPVQLQLGAGSVKTSGYLGSVWHATTTVNHSTGFLVNVDTSPGYTRQGLVTLARLDSLTWTITGVMGFSESARSAGIGGAVTLPGPLDRIRLTTVNGTDVFDAGSVNLMWE